MKRKRYIQLSRNASVYTLADAGIHTGAVFWINPFGLDNRGGFSLVATPADRGWGPEAGAAHSNRRPETNSPTASQIYRNSVDRSELVWSTSVGMLSSKPRIKQKQKTRQVELAGFLYSHGSHITAIGRDATGQWLMARQRPCSRLPQTQRRKTRPRSGHAISSDCKVSRALAALCRSW
jgi:hypothetical protein